jgi:cytochrome oxidase Cu insertion factor (SCO1/SenC/PrrC family)
MENYSVLTKTFFAGMFLSSFLVAGNFPGASSNQVMAQTPQKSPAATVRYACPMHPEVTSTKRKKCPKCGMTLRVVKDNVEKAKVEESPAPSSSPSEFPGRIEDATTLSSLKIPDILVSDQNGKQLRFYSDLVKGKTVAINFIFTTCTTICPPLTATFRRVQQGLVQSAPEAQLISVSVDPATDTPQRLNDFAGKFKAGPGWTFVTGDRAEIDSLLKALGVAVVDKNDHTPMILIGNDAAGYWTRAYGLASPTKLMKTISDAAARK